MVTRDLCEITLQIGGAAEMYFSFFAFVPYLHSWAFASKKSYLEIQSSLLDIRKFDNSQWSPGQKLLRTAFNSISFNTAFNQLLHFYTTPNNLY